MLKATIALSDLALNAAWIDGAIVLGKSQVIPYPHRMLETLFVCTEGQWFVAVRERLASRAGDTSSIKRNVDAEEFGRLYQECLLWPLDYVMIEVAQAGCRMKVRAGVFGTVPLFFRSFSDRIMLSWDPGDLLVGPLAIDAEMASHRLALHSIYAARQLIVGVTLLTERSLLYVEPGKVSYRYPSPAEETTPSPLPKGRDAMAAFGEHLRHIASLRPIGEGQVSAELSGGMDSATVACALAQSHGEVESLGILLDGDTRRSQEQRRRQIADRLGLHDHTVEMADYPPVVDVQPRPGQLPRLYWEYYLEPSMALWEQSRTRGCDTLFTGIGGDELFPYYFDETQAAHVEAWQSETPRYVEQLLTPRAWNAANSLHHFEAPASPVPASVLLAHASRTPDMLRHGFWPVNPLSHPNLVTFCHRLPTEHRQGREVMRQYLHNHLGEEIFSLGYVKESFAHVLPHAIARHARAITAQLRECVLADLGLIRPKAALELLDQVVATHAPVPTAVLVSFLWLERLARQVNG
jgi:asparagine synthase (glutamine-hydrolysing)